MAALDVCVVGEINPDLILYGVPKTLEPEKEILVQGFRATLGSSSAIFAHNLSALGARVGMVSKIGNDALGKLALGWLSRGGVDITRVREARDGIGTGVTVILARSRERIILTYPGTIFGLGYEDIDLDYVFSARHLHVSSYFLQRGLRPKIGDLFREARRSGLTTSLDTNDDPEGLWEGDLPDVLPYVDIFFPNEREAKSIAREEDLSDALSCLSRRVGTVAVKLGPQGAVVRRGTEEWRCSPLRVNVIDTVGAGDSFDSGFIFRFLQGAAAPECLEYANVAGAYSTTADGGTSAFCDRERMTRFFEEHCGK